MLKFIGLGLDNETDISFHGMNEAKKSQHIFAEFYTNIMSGLSIQNLELMLGKKVTVLSREDVEERADTTILNHAKHTDVSILIPGDPMIATTHIDLRLRAEKLGISCSIIHASSISSAITCILPIRSFGFFLVIFFIRIFIA